MCVIFYYIINIYLSKIINQPKQVKSYFCPSFQKNSYCFSEKQLLKTIVIIDIKLYENIKIASKDVRKMGELLIFVL